jgi:hypothetical protein
LILIEIKSTYQIQFLKEKHQHEKQLLYAGHQLSDAIDALRKSKELREDVTGECIGFEDLKIKSIIVSTSFEFDGEKFGEYNEYGQHVEHHKHSLLELMLLLRKNELPKLIMSSPKVKDFLQQNPYDGGHINQNDLDLYDIGTGTPKIEDFIKALESGKLWKKMLPYW